MTEKKDTKERKDVNIEVPCLELEFKPHTPNQNLLTLHLVAVPGDALPEVQEVLKKYQASFDKINEALKKEIKPNKPK